MYYVQSLLRESLLDYDEDAAVAEGRPGEPVVQAPDQALGHTPTIESGPSSGAREASSNPMAGKGAWACDWWGRVGVFVCG
jgi:hypothetical protein